CGNRWCVVGTARRQDVFAPAHAGQARNPRRKIRGWYDDQRLATTTNGVFGPTFRATIIPVDNLASLNLAALMRPGIFNLVARIEIPNNVQVPEKYKKAYGLEVGVNEIRINLIDDESGVAKIRNLTYNTVKTVFVKRR